MKTFQVENFGPIEDARVALGDLTFIIGEQASGKSLFLELLKLSVDKAKIVDTLQRYNFILRGENFAKRLLDFYLGEGMSSLWTDETKIALDDQEVVLDLKTRSQSPSNRLFYVPAQRIFSLDDGRPKSFTEFNQSTTPYVLRDFSEMLRLFLQIGIGEEGVIYPQPNRIKGKIKERLDQDIFHHAQIVMDQASGQQKMKLEVDGARLPFLAWSAGQKEFAPLLLAFYCLTGPAIPIIRSEDYQIVVIEEPEMGLHASAIRSILLQILDLVTQGKQVIVSTHSTIFLEFAWAFQRVKSSPQAVELLLELFGIKENIAAKNRTEAKKMKRKNVGVKKMFEQLLEKCISTHLFYRKDPKGKVVSQDISQLDAFSDLSEEVDWGGLSSFAERANEVVAKVASEM